MAEATPTTASLSARESEALSNLEDEIRARTARTQAVWLEAKEVVPDGFSRARFFWPNPLYIDRGEGSHIFDVDGNRYVDCLMGFGVLVLGHAHPVVVEAVARQLPRGTQFGAAVEAESELAALVCAHVPGAERMLLLNSGTEATHAAIRIAVAATGRQRVAKFEGGWHGWGDWLTHSMLHVGGEVDDPATVPGSKGIPEIVAPNVLTLPYNHDAALDLIRANADTLACVVMEGVQASAGGIVAERPWAQAVRQACRDAGIVFVLDEVVTGFRVGAAGAAGLLAIEPDLVTLAKTIGGGFPIGAVCGRADLLDLTLPDARRERVLVAGTFSGNPISVTAGLAQLSLLTEDPAHFEHMNAIGDRLRDGLRDALDGAGVKGHVAGVGPLWGMHLRTERLPRTVRESEGFIETGGLALAGYLLREGVLQSAPVHNGYLSAVHTEEDVDLVVEAHRRALGRMVEDGLLGG